jgi:NADPH:quinone reductase-like Zn-dependent oxidoreductase
VGRFEEGDKVFGYVDLMKGQKTHQEYLCINPDCIALMPKNLDFEQAAALPLGSLTSLVALTEVGEVKQGTELLVNGASGGLGVYSLQLAKILGAHTAAIAGPGQESFLTGLGAKTVYNYKETKLESLSQTFDVILDLSNKRSFKEVKPILSAHGRFIPLETNKHILSFFMNFLSSQKMKFLMVDKGNNEKLSQIAKWVEESKLKVFVDSVFSFADYEKAFLRMDEQGKRGRVVLKIAEDD